MKKRLVSLLTAVVMLTALTGCGGKKDGADMADMEKGEAVYPIQTDETITYWVRLVPALGTAVTNYGETEFAKEYMKRTGIKVEYLHPASGDQSQALNLLIASGDLPDIVEANWLSQNPSSMIEDNVIIPLNDYMEYAPNLVKYLKENPDVDKQIKTDDGKYYVFPFVRNGETLLSTAGFMARADWMEELGLEAPETIEEWESFLEAMKTKCEYPLAVSQSSLMYFCGAYDMEAGFYIDDKGKVQRGILNPEYKEFITTMKRWYDKGYIDKNFVTLDSKQIQSNMLNGNSAVAFGAGGSMMGLYLNAMKDDKSGFDLVALPFPTKVKGRKAEFGNKQLKYSPMNGAAITASAKNPALCMRLLDYSYSEEGNMLNNFGIEGVSYEVKDGVPTYTDIITNNADGLSMSQTLPQYVRAANEGPFVQDERYIEQYYQYDQQKDALKIWGNNNHEKHKMPQVTLTNEETKELSDLNSAIGTYNQEMFIKFITGKESIEKFNDFVKKLKDMGIERTIEIEQAAVDRFNKR